VNKELRAFNVPFSSLKHGDHQFTFVLDDKFFTHFEHSLIDSAEVKIHMNLHKSETMMSSDYHLSGMISTTCDRCNDPMNIEVSGDFKLVFKFGHEESGNEELIVLPPEAYQLELAPYFYEFVNLLRPARVVHDEGLCNEEMVELMKKYLR
jgi:uncharacterized metal-binding protein YceD (DUF177 family)